MSSIRKKEIRKASSQEQTKEKFNFSLKEINPLTDNQQLTFDYYDDRKHLLLAGTAGTGKTFLALYLAMSDIMEEKQYDKLVIIRSAVPTREMGFVPGDKKQKAEVYESPYGPIFTELFGRGDAYEYLKQKKIIDFLTTSFIRGITINNAVIVVDECQSMTWHELTSIMTRVGKNCRIIFCGDTKQNDLHAKRNSEISGMLNLMDVVQRMKEFETVIFRPEDIVRSGLVKSFLIACEELGY